MFALRVLLTYSWTVFWFRFFRFTLCDRESPAHPVSPWLQCSEIASARPGPNRVSEGVAVFCSAGIAKLCGPSLRLRGPETPRRVLDSFLSSAGAFKGGGLPLIEADVATRWACEVRGPSRRGSTSGSRASVKTFPKPGNRFFQGLPGSGGITDVLSSPAGTQQTLKRLGAAPRGMGGALYSPPAARLARR